MLRKFLFCALFAMAAQAGADTVALQPDHPQSYVVKKGDTLWDISGKFLRYPWQWPDIWEVNPQIENPHLIYPGDQLSLTYRDGKPILSLARGRRVKLSPSVRAYGRGDAIAPIPLDAIQQFLTRPRVVSEAALENAAYVVGSQDGHLVTGMGNRIYIRGLTDPQTNKFSVFRRGEVYRDPRNEGRIIGYEALHVGDVLIERLGDPATAVIVYSNREIISGDRLFPQEDDEYLEFIPHAPDGAVDGDIISVIDGVSQIGQYQLVVMNLGAGQGLEPGHVLSIHQAGEVVIDYFARNRAEVEAERAEEDAQRSWLGKALTNISRDLKAVVDAGRPGGGELRVGTAGEKVQLPEERAGELMVVRTFDNVSYGLVMSTQRPVHILDRVRNP